MPRKRKPRKHRPGPHSRYIGQAPITLVNPGDRDYVESRFILWFGAAGGARLMVWANHLEDALEEAVDWIVDNAPGLLADDEVKEEYDRLRAEGKDEEEAMEGAEVDMTSCDGGHYLRSDDWGIVAEDPSREEVLEIEGRPPEKRARGADPLARKRPARRATATLQATPVNTHSMCRYYGVCVVNQMNPSLSPCR